MLQDHLISLVYHKKDSNFGAIILLPRDEEGSRVGKATRSGIEATRRESEGGGGQLNHQHFECVVENSEVQGKKLNSTAMQVKKD